MPCNWPTIDEPGILLCQGQSGSSGHLQWTDCLRVTLLPELGLLQLQAAALGGSRYNLFKRELFGFPFPLGLLHPACTGRTACAGNTALARP